MADPVAIVERIVKIGLKIKAAVDTVQHNEDVCQEIRKRVLRFSAILSQLQRRTGAMDDSPATSGALQDLEATLERALELVTACQERSVVRRLVKAGDLAKQLRGVNDDISNKVMLASFAVNAHTTIILLANQAAVHPSPRQPEDTGLMEVSRDHSTDDVRSQPDVEENKVLSGSEAAFPPLVATLRKFRLSELKAATNGFSNPNTIGSGGSVTVYKGVLNDQNVVAIKKLRSEPRLGWAHTYSQLLLASKLQHRNVVKVLGYAHEDEARSFMAWLKGRKSGKVEKKYIWVEEYMPMGNLHEIIYNQEHQPDWSSLLRIIEGVAQGMHYLHEQRILHLDLKPANILLDCHVNPKITDFDLAKELDDNEGTHVNPNTSGMNPTITDFGLMEVMDDKMTTQITGVAGTFGYLAPEYVLNGTVSTKRDVYAFGITLLETVGCIRSRFNRSRQHPIGRWAWEAWEAGLLEQEFDPKLFDEYQLLEIKRCIKVGLLCAQSDRADRPSMEDVVAMLSGEKELPAPKKPEYIKAPANSTPCWSGKSCFSTVDLNDNLLCHSGDQARMETSFQPQTHRSRFFECPDLNNTVGDPPCSTTLVAETKEDDLLGMQDKHQTMCPPYSTVQVTKTKNNGFLRMQEKHQTIYPTYSTVQVVETKEDNLLGMQDKHPTVCLPYSTVHVSETKDDYLPRMQDKHHTAPYSILNVTETTDDNFFGMQDKHHTVCSPYSIVHVAETKHDDLHGMQDKHHAVCPSYNIVHMVQTKDDDMLEMQEKYQRQQHDLQQRELKQQHREDQLKRWEKKLKRRQEDLKMQQAELLMREVLLQRRRDAIRRQEGKVNMNRKYPRWTQ